MQISEIINNFKETRQQLANDFAETNDADKYLLEHSRAADQAVREILKLKELSSRISVVAIGGFGREQLFPYSDLDLLFLLPDDVLDSELNSVGAVIGELWSLGLTVGYSVRKIDECIEQAAMDITAQTAMLESRLIEGDSELFKRYTSELEKAWISNPSTGLNLSSRNTAILSTTKVRIRLNPISRSLPAASGI